MMSDRPKCDGCYYEKPRDADPATRELAWGPWCLESGQPVKCEIAVVECDKGESQEDQERASAQMALKYAIRNKRKR